MSQLAFSFNNDHYGADFEGQLMEFSFNGQQTQTVIENGIKYFINEFWTSKQRASHSLHEISYRACFKANLPEFFISRLTSEGEKVYDPFMGRGTTLIEASLLKRIPLGNDVNPISRMLCEARLNPPTIKEIINRLDEIELIASVKSDSDLLEFFHIDTLSEIIALKQYFADKTASGSLDHIDLWIRMVAINRLTGHSKGFFSVYTLPPNQAVSIESQRKINIKRNQRPDYRNTKQLIISKSRDLLKAGSISTREYHIQTGLASHTPSISTHSIDLVITSPPFLDVVQYSKDNWLRCWFADIDASQIEISMHRKREDWREFVNSVFAELTRLVKSGGHIAFEVGEVRNGKIKLEKDVIEAVKNFPLRLIGVVVNLQEFTKTANVWGVSNNSKGTNSNRILVFRRD